jgi:biopolymer transport protein ExbD
MLKKRGMPASHSEHPNVTPLIDVVMCLIIFYMLVAKIGVDTGKEKAITLPTSLMGIKLNDLGSTVTLNVLKPPFGDEPLITTMHPLTGETLTLKIISDGKRELANVLKQVRGNNAEFKVIIRADQDLDYRFLQPVLLSCAEAKVKNVNFATREPGAVQATGG